MNFRKSKLKLASIKPYTNNPRVIPPRAIAAVASSIEKYGYNVPIVVDKNKVILTGHTRLLALKELGWDTAEVLVAKELTPEQAKQFRVVDNRVGEISEWDQELLRDEIRAVGGEEFEAFFTSDELDKLLKALDESPAANNPSQEEIDKQQESNDSKYTEKDKEARSNVIEVCCPKCEMKYSVDKRVVLP